MITQGFKCCDFDWELHVRRKSRHSKPTLVMSYVDDLIIAVPSREEIDGILKGLRERWEVKEETSVSLILGIKISRNRQNRSFFISPTATISSLHNKFPSNNRQRSNPLPHVDLQSITDDRSSSIHPQKYQELIGPIQWLAGTTRPDIAVSASYLARFAAAPRETHWQMALRVVSYFRRPRTRDWFYVGCQKEKR